MLHIILPDFRDYKSLKIGAKDKVKFIAPEDGNSTFGAEALILVSRTKAEIVNIKDSSPIQMAFVIGRIAGTEKGDITVHSEDKEMVSLTAPKKTVARATRKTPAAPEVSPASPSPAASEAPVKKARAPRSASPSPATARPKAVKPNVNVITRLIKSKGLDQSYVQLICDQFDKEGVSEITIDTYVRTAASLKTNDKEEIKALGELAKKHWNEIIR